MRIPVVRRVMERNDAAAAENRARFDASGVACVNILGGAGCGKTALLEAVLPRLSPKLAVGVLEGDLATTRDAERIAALHVPVVQLLTDGACHLTAWHVQRALNELPATDLDLVIIENVGNPICPANFDLGQHERIAVLSAAEGDDKPSKYPLLFRGAGLVVISKSDLLPHVSFDVRRAVEDVRRMNPTVECVQTSARTGEGIVRLADWLARLRTQRRQVACPGAPASIP